MANKKSHKPQIKLTKDASPIDAGLRFGSKDESDAAANALLDLIGSDDSEALDSIPSEDDVNATHPSKRGKTKTAR